MDLKRRDIDELRDGVFAVSAVFIGDDLRLPYDSRHVYGALFRKSLLWIGFLFVELLRIQPLALLSIGRFSRGGRLDDETG